MLIRGCQYKDKEGAEMLNEKSYDNGKYVDERSYLLYYYLNAIDVDVCE